MFKYTFHSHQDRLIYRYQILPYSRPRKMTFNAEPFFAAPNYFDSERRLCMYLIKLWSEKGYFQHSE